MKTVSFPVPTAAPAACVREVVLGGGFRLPPVRQRRDAVVLGGGFRLAHAR